MTHLLQRHQGSEQRSHRALGKAPRLWVGEEHGVGHVQVTLYRGVEAGVVGWVHKKQARLTPRYTYRVPEEVTQGHDPKHVSLLNPNLLLSDIHPFAWRASDS